MFKIPLIEESHINSFDGDRAPTHLNDFDQSCISFLKECNRSSIKECNRSSTNYYKKIRSYKKCYMALKLQSLQGS